MPDGRITLHDDLIYQARRIWPTCDRYVLAAVAWVEFIAPEKADHAPPDREMLALHTMLLGFDGRYYSGLLRLFTLLRMDDR